MFKSYWGSEEEVYENSPNTLNYQLKNLKKRDVDV